MPLAPLQEHDVHNEDAPSVCAAKGWSRQPPRSPPVAQAVDGLTASLPPL